MDSDNDSVVSLMPNSTSRDEIDMKEIATAVTDEITSCSDRSEKELRLPTSSLFYTLGFHIGDHPRLFLLLSMLLSLTSLGMMKIVLRDSIREGYTAINARSRYETEVMREFLSCDLMKTVILLVSKDKGSIHRKAHLDEAENILNYIYNLTVNTENRSMMYRRLCKPYCTASARLFYSFKKYFDINYKSAIKNHYYSDLFNLSYPFGKIWDVRIPLEKVLYGVKLVKTTNEITNSPSITKARVKRYFDENIFVDPNKAIETQITNMEHVSLIMLILYAKKDNPVQAKELAFWELGTYQWSKQYNKRNSLVRVLIFGNEILDMEINLIHRKLAPYFGTGFASMIGFVAFCVLSSACYYDTLDRGKVLVGVGAVLCPLLAITSTFGFLSLIGSRINSFLFVTPFLIMGVGIDAAFLMVSSWQKLAYRRYTQQERLGLVYEEAIPSIAITSVTNVLSFAIGATTPTPEIRLFGFGTALAMGLTFFFQLFLFGPVLSLATTCEKTACPVEKHHRQTSEDGITWKWKIKIALQALLRTHSQYVMRKRFQISIIAIAVMYWAYTATGVFEMKTRLDAAKILPKHSLLHEGNTVLTELVWKEVFTITFYINTRFNISDMRVTRQFWDMLKELESLPNCRGHSSSYVWFRDFVQKYSRTKEAYPYSAQPDSRNLDSFLENNHYHFNTSLKHSRDSGHITINKFFFTVAYTNITDWDTRINLVTECRDIIDRYPELNATLYESGGMFVDQMLSLKRVTLRAALLTFVSMAAVCAVFMRNLCAVITSSLCIASISTGVIGTMSKLSFELDPIVMASLLMTIGMSVDYVAHVAYHFQLHSRTSLNEGREVQIQSKTTHDRLENTIKTVAWPMVQAGSSTICCVLPLLAVNTYSSKVFVTAILLVVLLGFVHGIFILPALLCLLPERLYTYGCCQRKTDERDEDSASETDANPTDLG